MKKLVLVLGVVFVVFLGVWGLSNKIVDDNFETMVNELKKDEDVIVYEDLTQDFGFCGKEVMYATRKNGEVLQEFKSLRLGF